MTITLNAQETIEMALRRIGVLQEDTDVSSYQLSKGRDALRLVIEGLNNEGYRLFQLERKSKDLVDGTASYDLEAEDFEILTAYIDDGVSDKPLLDFISSDEYMDIADKTLEGTPRSIYLEYAATGLVTAYLYPVPNDSDLDLNYLAVKKITDLSANDTNVGFAANWLEVVVMELAYRLSYEYSLDAKLRVLLREEADRLKKLAKKRDFQAESFDVACGSY